MSTALTESVLGKISSEELANSLSYSPSGDSAVPRHVAIIMDGNGRWAQRRGRPRVFGHIRGCSRVREIIRESDRLGVKALTLYAFSSENWGHPSDEVGLLMTLLRKWLKREQREIMAKNIRFRAIGCISKLPKDIREIVQSTTAMSSGNSGLQLTLALSYGGREELVNVVKALGRKIQAGELSPDQVSEEMVESELLTSEIGDPDLLIRTSGEQRISNFLLWQCAYTELYFTDTMWPDFRTSDLRKALDSYSRRVRRFGLTAEQIST